ncbi:Root phototropism protein 3 [Cocos nucifera]|uniref:Root phototropism protein 3 n=1 Tax=Cocos nucifera TaxID=13894 RepID=A0A8K0MYQ1_COCNU|nr:Root phototropism protein 3 [Cocos nucifera]
MAVDLTASNIAGLRCAAEYLEMTEDLEEGNLIFKTEAFLSYVVLSSWRDSIVVLKSCEDLSPWAENLQIVRRCSESIAWKARATAKGTKLAHTGMSPKTGSPKWNGKSKEGSSTKHQQVPPDWWFEDVSTLRIDHFVRVVTAIKVKGMRFELIGATIIRYASKWLPGLVDEATHGYDNTWNQGGGNMIVAGNSSEEELSGTQVRARRMVVESLISIIPPIKDCVSCSFLLQLLRLAKMLRVAHASIADLEKRIGMQLEQASLADLLIPSYGKCETFYDVELVQRLVEHFKVQEQTQPSSPGRESLSDEHRQSGPSAKARAARLLDGYLSEVSRDRNLSPTKFQALAEALPESARTSDDGLYRAIDSYLKAHPTLSEHERKRLCRLMDCRKISVDACMHAAQNDRLPLRFVVQILFSEQVKISNAIANSSLQGGGEPMHYQPMIPTRKQLLEGTPLSFQEGWAAATKDISTLTFELEDMKAKYTELQRDMDRLRSMFEKMTSLSSRTIKHRSSSRTSRWKKLSKLTRITGMEDNEMEAPVEARKEPRRRRYSIS